MDDHELVGTWLLQVDSPEFGPISNMYTFTPDGRYAHRVTSCGVVYEQAGIYFLNTGVYFITQDHLLLQEDQSQFGRAGTALMDSKCLATIFMCRIDQHHGEAFLLLGNHAGEVAFKKQV